MNRDDKIEQLRNLVKKLHAGLSALTAECSTNPIIMDTISLSVFDRAVDAEAAAEEYLEAV